MPETPPIVSEELQLLEEATERLGRAAGRTYASEDEIIGELQHIQEQIRGGKSDDKSAFEQLQLLAHNRGCFGHQVR